MRKSIFALLTVGFICLTSTISAQIQVTNTMTPQQLIENILLGSGVTAQNIKVNGQAALASTIQVNATYFNKNGTTFGIADGVLLTTGRGSVAVGPNNGGMADDNSGTSSINDADMNAISASSVENGITIEFDFLATGNLLEFKYVFGSEEYPEFAPPNSSSFNDVFGFFLSGAGINGPYSNNAINIATIPGTTTPVSINNVNPLTNSTFYRNNVAGVAWGNSIQYDGTTVIMTATADLVCGETYHIKLGIANVGDEAYDSGVFLEGGSFSVNPIDFSFATNTNDNTILEGCNQFGELTFSRSGCGTDSDTLIGLVTFSGTATNGVDYSLLGDTVVLLPGVNQVTWLIEPFEDFITEGIETIDIEVKTFIAVVNDTIVSTGQFFINDRPEITLTPQNATSYCWTKNSQIGVTPAGGIAPYHYSWTGIADTTQTINVADTVNGVKNYAVTVTDDCGYTQDTIVTLTTNQTLAIDSFIMEPATCLPVGSVSALTFPFGGHLQNPSNPTSYNLTYTWTYGPNHTGSFPNQSAIGDLPAGWYYLSLTDNVIQCTVSDSVLVEAINVPQAIPVVTPASGCAPLNVTIKNESVNSTSYAWDFGDGTTTTTSDLSPLSHTYTESQTITLVASNGDVNCNDTTTIVVDVVTCGCMDPLATNYDPNAVMEGGECIYPLPTAEAPNVITMNGDGVNDGFFLTTTNASSIELRIVNRWGSVVYYGTGDQTNQPTWNGKNKSGKEVSEGVYFYTYLVKGPNGDETEGHGFVTVVK